MAIWQKLVIHWIGDIAIWIGTPLITAIKRLWCHKYSRLCIRYIVNFYFKQTGKQQNMGQGVGLEPHFSTFIENNHASVGKWDPSHKDVAQLNCFVFSVLCSLNGGMAAPRSLKGASSFLQYQEALEWYARNVLYCMPHREYVKIRYQLPINLWHN